MNRFNENAPRNSFSDCHTSCVHAENLFLVALKTVWNIGVQARDDNSLQETLMDSAKGGNSNFHTNGKFRLVSRFHDGNLSTIIIMLNKIVSRMFIVATLASLLFRVERENRKKGNPRDKAERNPLFIVCDS